MADKLEWFHYVRCTKAEAKEELLDWLSGALLWDGPEDGALEFWADYASYDWIVLCQLFGTMLDLPRGFPMFVKDIQQLKGDVGFVGKLPEVVGQAHNAADDAANVRDRYDLLVRHREDHP